MTLLDSYQRCPVPPNLELNFFREFGLSYICTERSKKFHSFTSTKALVVELFIDGLESLIIFTFVLDVAILETSTFKEGKFDNWPSSFVLIFDP